MEPGRSFVEEFENELLLWAYKDLHVGSGVVQWGSARSLGLSDVRYDRLWYLTKLASHVTLFQCAK